VPESIRASTIDVTIAQMDIERTGDSTFLRSLINRLGIHTHRQALIHELKLEIVYIDAKG
jgi:hypothetical protein